MSKINTSLHADHQLDQLAGQFAHWRQSRSHPGERLPQHFWDHAVTLARGLPRSRVAQHLRVSPGDLNKRMATPPDLRPAAPPTPLVEVPPTPSWPPAPPAMEIELERADGARLRLRCPEAPVSVAALVRAFVEGA